MRQVLHLDPDAMLPPPRMLEAIDDTPLHETREFKLERVDANTRKAIRDLDLMVAAGHPFGHFYSLVADVLRAAVKTLDAIDELDRATR